MVTALVRWDPQAAEGGQPVNNMARPFAGLFSWADPQLIENMLQSGSVGKETPSHWLWELERGSRVAAPSQGTMVTGWKGHTTGVGCLHPS